jgi:predicted DNA-binding transcriptional regulator AlpA
MSNGRKESESRRSLTINRFLRKHGISRSTYYDLKKRGLGPTEMRIGDRIVRISSRADRECVEKMEALKSPALGDQGRADAKTILRQKGRSKGSTPSSPPSPHVVATATKVPRSTPFPSGMRMGAATARAYSPRRTNGRKSAPLGLGPGPPSDAASSQFRSGRRQSPKNVYP